jgi:hypothetical protein
MPNNRPGAVQVYCHPVQSYTMSGGTRVQSHQHTNPNNTQRDNYSARGNVNPYTGAVGARNPKYWSAG